jgi:hypothetical protein
MPVPFCSDPLKLSFDLASQLIAVISRAKNEAFAMQDKRCESSKPAAPRCPRCAQPMHLVRRTPRFGGLPDLHTFECQRCELSHSEEGGPARWRDTDLFRLFRFSAKPISARSRNLASLTAFC